MQTCYTLPQIAAIVGGELYTGTADIVGIHDYSFDTRLLSQPGSSLFLALAGNRRDGHQYAGEAFSKGVRNFLVSRRLTELTVAHQLVVPDVLAALQKLAGHQRAQFAGTVVGITGSNGKTIVKEWLATLLEGSKEIWRSPRSYNSQLGVALTLLGLEPQHEVAIVEAGISQRGEMHRLAAMVSPTLGILTHMGDAHSEGFASFDEKVQEKLLLFKTARKVVAVGQLALVQAVLNTALPGIEHIRLGDGANVQLTVAEELPSGWELTFREGGLPYKVCVPVPGPAAFENALLAILAARQLQVSWDAIALRAQHLAPVALRTELVSDNPDITVLADAYNADAVSVRNAFAQLVATQRHPRRRVVLTDLAHQGSASRAVHQALMTEAIELFGTENIQLVGPIFQEVSHALPNPPHTFNDTDALIQAFDYNAYLGSTVLLKGSRSFALERLLPLLTRHPGESYLKINLGAALHNLQVLQKAVPASTGSIVMLKAGAYGTGSWQLAQELDRHGVDYYGVAQTYEGIELRSHGITTIIMVLNSGPDVTRCWLAGLEPVVSTFEQLQHAALSMKQNEGAKPLHLEFDTGMGRLGFATTEVEKVLEILASAPQLDVVSCFTHLAAAEDPAEDDFTRAQLDAFSAAADVLQLAYPAIKRHALNTGGILRFPEYAWDYVRIGIGLYGIDPRAAFDASLIEIGSLHSHIAQVHNYPSGTTVGYGRREVLQRDSKIATVPLGYADGIPRRVGERRYSLLVRGELAPIVGRVCMDLLMLDVTDIPDALAGDEVVVFGEQRGITQSVRALAEAAGTIAYEILASIPARVRRVYVKE